MAVLYFPFKVINWFACDTPLDFQEEKIRNGIIKIMRGNAKTEKHLKDALHIFDAAKSEGFLIDVDKRILKKRDEVSKYLLNKEFCTF